MDRLGYDLIPVVIPANGPSYLSGAMLSAQREMDNQYLHGPGGLDNFYDQADTWVTTQKLKRGSNRAYAPDPFPMAIPRRMGVVASDDGYSFTTQALPADPRIKMPVLEPLPPEQPPTGAGGPLSGGGNYQPLADPAQMFAAVLDAIRGMESRLRELILMKG